MSELDPFSDEPPPIKQGLPAWLWVCGSGCLLGTILLLVLAGWLVSSMMGPEAQWESLAEILPYDHRPPELSPEVGASLFGAKTYFFTDSRGFNAQFMRLPGEADQIREQFMNADNAGPLSVLGERRNVEPGTLEVQGRELQLLRYDQSGKSTVMVDLTAPEVLEPLFLLLTRVSVGGRVADSELKTFLEPFHVGPDR